jgi:TetR/AcrR family transcriptional regulator, transcriptional repressor for nem operon
MPRVSRAEAESHRQQITEASARLFKERGINGVSVADLMGAAGLTHGGFYGHFESKDALAGVAVTHAFGQSAERWSKRIAAQPDDAAGRAAIVDKFLSAQSLREVGLGCPSVSLAADVAREPAAAPIRTAYLDGLESLLQILAGIEDAPDAAAQRRAAIADYATMAGALMLARATEGAPLSAEFLAAARERLLAAPTPARANALAPAPARERTAARKTSRKA